MQPIQSDISQGTSRVFRRRRPGAGPPGPKGLPFVGHLFDVRRDVLQYFTDCSRHYGDVVALRFAGWPTLLLTSPEHIEQVLVRDHRKFVKNSFFWRQVTAIFGNGLLTSEGDFWVRQRRLAAPAFAGQRLSSYGPVMVQQTERMLDGWEVGRGRDLHHDMMSLTLKIAAKALFDAEVERDVAEIDDAVNVLANEIAVRFTRPFVIPDAIPLPSNIRYRRALRRVEETVARIIKERLRTGEDAGDLLSMLIKARDETGQPMSDRQLRDESITILLAGHETTALALSWTWLLLGQHPDIQARLSEECAAVLGKRAATVEDLGQLVFAEHVVMEAMRLFPPAWAIGREAAQDCEIGGYPVASGTTIIMSPWVIHRDERHFQEPAEFRPDRWRDDLARRLPRFAYFPFGGGPRICIGHRFAIMEAVLILVTMVQRFRLELQRDGPVETLPSITLRPKGGVWAAPLA